MTLRAALCWGILLLTPVAVYAPTVFQEYGMRDDYSLLREARESPRGVVRFTSSYGRPVFGALLAVSLRAAGSVTGLQWLRLTSVVLLTLVAVALWRVLQGAGVPAVDAAAIGLAIALLPSAQIVAGWAIAWPITCSLLCAIAGFAAVEKAQRASGTRRAAFWSAGFAAYLLAALTYQGGVMFAVVPLAAVALSSDAGDVRARVRWLAAHLATPFAGVAVALAAMTIAFALGVVPSSGAIAFELQVADKVLWFVEQPLANALGLFAIRDRFATPAVFWLAPAAAAALIAAGLLWGPKPARAVDRVSWLACLVALPFVAHAANLAAAGIANGYRALFPLAGLFVVLAVSALRRLRAAGRIGAGAHEAVLVAAAGGAALLAGYHARTLIAEPQSREWAIVRDAVRVIPFEGAMSLFIVRPRIEERSTRRIFADEFGSLSSNSDWATDAMFRAALHERFPNGLAAGTTYTLGLGLDGPGPGPYDAVIDMRKLAEYRED